MYGSKNWCRCDGANSLSGGAKVETSINPMVCASSCPANSAATSLNNYIC